MKLLRRLAIFAMKYNFDYSAIHVEGKRIPKADALSRFRFQVFRALSKRRRRTNRSRQRSLPRPYIASLDFQWMHLMAFGLSKATHLSHSSGQRCFIDFCLQFGLLIPVIATHLSHSSGQRCFIDFCLQFGLLIPVIAFCRHRLLQFRVSLVIYRFLINHLRLNHIYQRLDPCMLSWVLVVLLSVTLEFS